MRNLNLEKLEDVAVTFGKNAFSPRRMYCEKCSAKMKRASVEMTVSHDVRVGLMVFRCPRCKEEVLDLDEARKLDRALVISRLLSRNAFNFKRRLSHDGHNYIFRLPRELTQGRKYTEVKIVPLEHNEALIEW